MSRHLQACKARKQAIGAEANAEERLFHLAVAGTYASDYWMHLEIPAAATLQDVDQFLRDVWLECCGHLSMFRIHDIRYQCMMFDDGGWGTRDPNMEIALGKVLTTGLQFSYEYDFGSTTDLVLKVVGERRGVAPKGSPVRVLARNEPPDLRCELCGRPAAWIDIFGEYVLFCEACREERLADERIMPLVNSPRTGVCGYVGDAWD
jgi:hypothetical protein